MATPSPYWQGPRIRLRPMHRGDVDLWLVEEQEAVEATHFLNAGMPLPKSRHDAEVFATKYAEFGSAEERLMFSIETLDGTLVGGMNLHSMDRRSGIFQTGSRIYRAFRGRGYGLEAKRIVLRYAFLEQRFQKYKVLCSELNDAMVRHMVRLGAVQEGRLRRHLYTHGAFEDALCFGLTREEFDAYEARQPTS